MNFQDNPHQLRRVYLDYFCQRDHVEIPSSPLVPENDPTTLFTSSGMQPLITYLLEEKHPSGKRLVNCQLSFRSQDIEELGDNRHTTFFEMLGNWSLGDYFKTEQLTWFFEFLTTVVGLAPARLYVSVFDGWENIGKDTESTVIWQRLFGTSQPARLGSEGFDPAVKIYRYGVGKNWWSRAGEPDIMPPGEPGGPDSEVFFDFDPENRYKFHQQSPFASQPCHINCDCGRFMEIGNSVFMEYRKVSGGKFEQLKQKNVDFGGGLERIAAATADEPDIFRTALFWPLISRLERNGLSYASHQAAMRVVADHIRGAVFMAREGIEPGNKQQGYMMRRLIRRAVVKLMGLGLPPVETVTALGREVIKIFSGVYFEGAQPQIESVLAGETALFATTSQRAVKRLLEAPHVNGKLLFDLHQTYGLLYELSAELLAKQGRPVTPREAKEFRAAFEKHQRQSKTAAQGMFKGGLADSSREIVQYHTVTHLLHQALRDVLGEEVQQAGSNITAERLRFDFTYPVKLTDDQIVKVERLVNQKIQAGLPVIREEMSLDEAKKRGALAFFGEKYGAKVTVYSVGDYSKEVCGGPHVSNTNELRYIRIIKQESVGAGRRRVYAGFDRKQAVTV